MPDSALRKLSQHLTEKFARDELVQQTLTHLRNELECDRVVLYYFYEKWKGQVTFESLSSSKYSIFGSSGADECFNDEYAQLYLEGRCRAIPDTNTEPLHPCHREFLQSLNVQANLVVPILSKNNLWGLLIAHDCTAPRNWDKNDLKAMQNAAKTILTSPVFSRKSSQS